MPRPANSNLWTEADWTEYRRDLRRRKRLAHDLISLTIQKHCGIESNIWWPGLEMFSPGDRTFRVDAVLGVADVEAIRALLALPSIRYDSLESLDWKPFEDLRARLIEEVRAKGEEPELVDEAGVEG